MSCATDTEVQLDGSEVRFGELMGVINAATVEVVRLVEPFVIDESLLGGTGARSVEHWVCFQTGVSFARARRLVTMARRRSELPACWGLFEAGLLTEDAMAAIARRVPGVRDAEVAELAPKFMYSQLVPYLRSLPELSSGANKGRREKRMIEAGAVSFYLDDDGRLQLRADLPADDGTLFDKALRAARDDLFHRRHPDADADAPSTSITWAEALAHLAELGLCALDGGNTDRRPADRYQLLLHLNGSNGAVHWHMGDLVPDVLRRYLTCDSDLRLVFSDDGEITGFSSRSRTVDDKTRALIEHRDGGCRVPGCDQRRWLHIHHIVHWEDGGPTEPRNLCALCPVHHRMHHAGLLAIDGDPTTRDGLTFHDHMGRLIAPTVPATPKTPSPPPPQSFRHPIGERVDWRWFYWRNFENQSPNLN